MQLKVEDDHTYYEGSCFELWKYYGAGHPSPFMLVDRPRGRFANGALIDQYAAQYIIVDAMAEICLICSKPEGEIIVADWNTNEAVYAMVVDTAAEKEMPRKTI